MIKSIKIYNRFKLNNLAKFVKDGISPSVIGFNHKNWYLISIYTIGEDEGEYLTEDTINAISSVGCRGYLSLGFWDITDKESLALQKQFPHAVLFDKSHAKKVIDFLDEIRGKNPSEDEELLVHCSAGISRSGAVGTFACDYLGLDYVAFLRDNPYIRANHFVLSLLKNEAGMNDMFVSHDGIDNSFDKKEIIIL